MRTPLAASLLFLAACGGPAATRVAPLPFALPESTAIVDGATGVPVTTAAFLDRVRTADFVLLGEVHDNAVDHALRGALIAAFASRHPAVVFEQFAADSAPLPPPAADTSRDAWLDAHGFDRRGWRWPLHRPVVEAAIANGRSLWGSNVTREMLRSVVRDGAPAAPEPLRSLMMQNPMDSTGRAALEAVLVEGHCGQLPAALVPGMRAAQEVRDAAMTRALLLAGATGPAWLIAGNGHVRADFGVPRMLRRAAPRSRTLVVGLLEREENGASPDAAERRVYDLVIVTPRAVRPDPCANLRMPSRG